MPEWVFGYGSLASPAEAHAVSDLGEPAAVELRGFSRAWNVAMWNPAPENVAKHYVDPATGERPEIFVAFLNAIRAPLRAMNGVIIPVDHETVERFDSREANYSRIDVTDGIDPCPRGRVWIYTATDAGLERYRVGARDRNVFVSREYHAYCRNAFAQRGGDQLRRYEETTSTPGCPLRPLTLKRAENLTGF